LAAARSPAAERRATEVASRTFTIPTERGTATEPLDISLDWSQPQPHITRAVIVFHGVGRDVNGYYRTLQDAAEQAGSAARDTILIAPQFLDEEDVREHRLPKDILRWHRVSWEAGDPAVAPAHIGSYEIVDALLTRLADRSLFPDLKTIVLAGHSGRGTVGPAIRGGGKAAAALESAGIHLRGAVRWLGLPGFQSLEVWHRRSARYANGTSACGSYPAWPIPRARCLLPLTA
jgi:hypothetical protein